MTAKRRRAIWFGVVTIVLMGLFPPWKVVTANGVSTATGYALLFEPPIDTGSVVDGTRLLIQWLCVTLLVGTHVIIQQQDLPGLPCRQPLRRWFYSCIGALLLICCGAVGYGYFQYRVDLAVNARLAESEQQASGAKQQGQAPSNTETDCSRIVNNVDRVMCELNKKYSSKGGRTGKTAKN